MTAAAARTPRWRVLAPGARLRALAPVLGLFLLAPLVGEFLLGNLPITLLPALVLLAPLYGGGALLIRESSRRAGLSWPWLLVLCLAFGVIEEVFVTMSLFNPNYLGMRLLDYGYIPFLGMGAWWTVLVLSLHTIWSTAVPIALVEALAAPARRRTPWLGPVGLGVTAVVFVAGCAALLTMELRKGFVASAAQFGWSAVVVAVLIAAALLSGRRQRATPDERSPAPAPNAVLVGVASFVLGGAFALAARSRGTLPVAATVAIMLLVLAVGGVLALRASRRPGWGERHRLAVAGGLLLTYAWYGFAQPPVGNVSPLVDLVGNTIFATGAVVLLIVAAVKLRRCSSV